MTNQPLIVGIDEVSDHPLLRLLRRADAVRVFVAIDAGKAVGEVAGPGSHGITQRR